MELLTIINIEWIIHFVCTEMDGFEKLWTQPFVSLKKRIQGDLTGSSVLGG